MPGPLPPIPIESILSRIFLIRSQKVMLDSGWPNCTESKPGFSSRRSGVILPGFHPTSSLKS